MKNKKILIASGGGGHFSPALAVIKSLPPFFEVLVAGRKYALEGDKALSLEYQTTRSLNIPFVSITSGRLQRKFTKRTIPSLLKFPIGIFQAFFLIIKSRPNLVLSFGGYISLPIVFVAWALKIPVIIHEQTLGAGLANKIAAKFAKKVCISWESSGKYFPKEKIILTGNPVRTRVQSIKFKVQSKGLPTIFVTGGSSGSHFINWMVEQTMQDLVQSYNIIHQTGDSQEFKDYERLKQIRRVLPEKLQQRYTITKFIEPDEFGYIISKADLVISRSGMNTVSEILAFGKPSLLIPLPYSQGKEQLHNAQFVKDLGLGEILAQKNLTPEQFEASIQKMIENIGIFKKAGEEAKKTVVENAAGNIIKVIEDYI